MTIQFGKKYLITTAGRELFRGILTKENWIHIQLSYPACTFHFVEME